MIYHVQIVINIQSTEAINIIIIIVMDLMTAVGDVATGFIYLSKKDF